MLEDDKIDMLGIRNSNIKLFTHMYLIFISEKNIEEFMLFYRETFPHSTVLPKMHLMEDHMVPWLRKWHLGFGIMGEQGAESIHASFNTIKRSFANMMHNRVDWLKVVVREKQLNFSTGLQ